MKLYHGSPFKLKILKPSNPKGINKFENKSGVFLTKTFLHAALYAIGKTLKGKAIFGVSEQRLVILGNLKPKAGYVYEVEVKSPIRGPRGQYYFEEAINPLGIKKVFPKNYVKNIFKVKDKNELLHLLKKKS